MDTDKRIFCSMVLKTVQDRYLEDGFRNQRDLDELLQDFPATRVLAWAERIHEKHYGKEVYGGPIHGLPVVNGAETRAAPPQPEYSPQNGPQPIQQELQPQAAAPTLWASGPNDHIPPANINGMGKWGDNVPIKYKKGEVCQSTGKLWADTTYFDILDSFQMDLVKPGKPTYESDWDQLSYCIKTTKCEDPKWGKQNRWRVQALKAVMQEVSKRRPQQKKMMVPSEGRSIPSVEETQAAQAAMMAPLPMDDDTPF